MFFNDGVVLDFTDKPAGYAITISDLQEKLQKIEYHLKPFDIVMIRYVTTRLKKIQAHL
ncbi:cyclase family protein [Neobacillus sp. MER 74]|nr:cyclase family protein [Neobacillus sp. MER 74]MCM3113775.1 cyclase family protein [Neobacillus sp. MER 74]